MHARHRLHYLGDAVLQAGRGGIEQGVHGALAEAPADPHHDCADAEGRHGIRGRNTELDADQARDHHSRAPDVGLEMQRVGFEGLAVVFLRRAGEHAGA